RDCLFFFFNDTATTEIYTLSLHDALPIYAPGETDVEVSRTFPQFKDVDYIRSEEHTSELQSYLNLVCRLLLEKKNNIVSRGSAHQKCVNSAANTYTGDTL